MHSSARAEHRKGNPELADTLVRLAFRLLSDEREPDLVAWENLPKPSEYKYFFRNLLRNEFCEKSIAERAVEKLLAKLQGNNRSKARLSAGI